MAIQLEKIEEEYKKLKVITDNNRYIKELIYNKNIFKPVLAISVLIPTKEDKDNNSSDKKNLIKQEIILEYDDDNELIYEYNKYMKHLEMISNKLGAYGYRDFPSVKFKTLPGKAHLNTRVVFSFDKKEEEIHQFNGITQIGISPKVEYDANNYPETSYVENVNDGNAGSTKVLRVSISFSDFSSFIKTLRKVFSKYNIQIIDGYRQFIELFNYFGNKKDIIDVD